MIVKQVHNVSWAQAFDLRSHSVLGKSSVITFPSYSQQNGLFCTQCSLTLCVLAGLSGRVLYRLQQWSLLRLLIALVWRPVSVEKTDFIKSFYWQWFGTGRKMVTKLISFELYSGAEGNLKCSRLQRVLWELSWWKQKCNDGMVVDK